MFGENTLCDKVHENDGYILFENYTDYDLLRMDDISLENLFNGRMYDIICYIIGSRVMKWNINKAAPSGYHAYNITFDNLYITFNSGIYSGEDSTIMFYLFHSKDIKTRVLCYEFNKPVSTTKKCYAKWHVMDEVQDIACKKIMEFAKQAKALIYKRNKMIKYERECNEAKNQITRCQNIESIIEESKTFDGEGIIDWM
jgi:hypothetical protein